MREREFIKQNKNKWAELEEMLKGKEKNPDKLSDLFIQVTDDLSYSKTYFKNRTVRVYLNAITQQLFQKIYKNKSNKLKQVVLFWKEELPQIVYESRKELLLSLFVFLLSALIGVVSYANDSEFARTILGDTYIEMTNENIKSGDPMAVYKKSQEFDMFLGITFNNIFVAFRTFIFGLLAGIGSVGILVYNGIMVGVFQYFFIEKGLFVQSFLAIWLHGTLEISSIIIAGGAGVVLGKGLLFPGTYSRLQAFQLSAQKGLKLLIGVVPIFILAAVIESFMTRYTDTPSVVRAFIILLSALFMLSYFVIYPLRKARKGYDAVLSEGRIAPSVELKVDLNEIKSNGHIFKNTFMLYRKNIKTIFIYTLLLSFIYLLCTLFIYPSFFENTLSYEYWFFILNMFNYDTFPYLWIVNTLLAGALFYSASAFILKETEPAINKIKMGNVISKFLKSLLPAASLNALFLLPGWLSGFLLILLLPTLLLWQMMLFAENKNPVVCLADAFNLAFSSFGRTLLLQLMLSFISVICFFFIDSPFVLIYMEIINWNVLLNEEASAKLFNYLMLFNSVFVVQVIIPLLCLGFNISYYSLKEITYAHHLKNKIKNIGS